MGFNARIHKLRLWWGFPCGSREVLHGDSTFVAQEQICLKRLWISDYSIWNIICRSVLKRLKVDIEKSRPESGHLQGKMVLNVQFLSCAIPLWVFLFALGMSSDKEIIEMIDTNMNDVRCVNLLLSTMCYADDHFEGFRKGENSLKLIDEMIRQSKFPLEEGAKDCMEKYLIPTLSSLKQKAMLQAYSGVRKCENKDDFKNKRLDLASELLERELLSHIKHSERQMVKALQRDLYGKGNLHPIDY